jgi:hypothetical protein
MSNHHDNDHHSNEQKPVSFTVPFILAAVTLTVILLLVSLGDPCHGCVCDKDCSKECMEACEKGDHSQHPGTGGHEEHAGTKKDDSIKTDTTDAKEAAPTDVPTAEPAKGEHH